MGYKFLILLLLPLTLFATPEIKFKNNYLQKNSDYQKRLNEHKKFEKLIAQIHFQCPQLACQNGLQVLTIYNNQQFYVNQFPAKHLQILNQRAYELAQVWGDTILESDYIVKGQIKIDTIQAIYFKAQLITFRIVYSMQSYDLSECPQALNQEQVNCKAGRINEGSFISANFNHAVIDKNRLATFYK